MKREAGPGAIRSTLEILAILALTPVGLLLGGLSGSAALSSCLLYTSPSPRD